MILLSEENQNKSHPVTQITREGLGSFKLYPAVLPE